MEENDKDAKRIDIGFASFLYISCNLFDFMKKVCYIFISNDT